MVCLFALFFKIFFFFRRQSYILRAKNAHIFQTEHLLEEWFVLKLLLLFAMKVNVIYLYKYIFLYMEMNRYMFDDLNYQSFYRVVIRFAFSCNGR